MLFRSFVKVIGFSDVERHALNTVFRLSEQGDTVYCPWEPGAPEAPQLALVDGQSYEAPVEMASGNFDGLKLIWVGEGAPQEALHTFHRPIAWPQVVQAMDRVFAPAEPLDFDLDFDLDAPEQAVVDIDSGDIAAKRAHLERHLGTPTMVVESGGVTPEGQHKAHVWWKLIEPSEGDDIRRLTRLRGDIAAKVDDGVVGRGVGRSLAKTDARNLRDRFEDVGGGEQAGLLDVGSGYRNDR